MGTWGTSISSNDTYTDIHAEFMDLYNGGLKVSEISKKLISENQDLINDYESKNNFWFALAMAQWECKSLDKNILDKVKIIVDSGEDIKLWEELGAEQKDVKIRKNVLQKFIEKISIEKPKARNRKKKILRDSIFETGDCLTFKLINGNYGGAVVLSSEKQTEFGLNLIVTTTIDKAEEPIIEDFKNAFVLIQKEQTIPGKYREREMISWYYGQYFKRCDIDYKVIGQLKVQRQFDSSKDYQAFSRWEMIKTEVDRNDNFIRERGKPEKKLKLKKLIKKHWL